MKGKRTIRYFLILSILTSTSILAGGDPTHGATNFVFHPAGQLWHPIGSATEITTWDGPFDNATGHPSQVYMTFWKEPDGLKSDSAQVPDGIQVIHMLGTTFYYPKNAKPTGNPVAFGYTASDFKAADEAFKDFPNIASIFPEGIKVSGCHTETQQIFLLNPNKSSMDYLVMWQAGNQYANVAMMPAKLVNGSYNLVLDNVNYYAQGGMAEIMAFGSYFYYLARLPQNSKFDFSVNGTASRKCPDIPSATAHGLKVPQSWTNALISESIKH